jgi:hypothetical protein
LEAERGSPNCSSSMTARVSSRAVVSLGDSIATTTGEKRNTAICTSEYKQNKIKIEYLPFFIEYYIFM